MTERPGTKDEAANKTVDATGSAAYDTHDPPASGPTEGQTAPAFGPPSSPQEVGTLGPYRVVKELGRGGMGAVYLAFDERLQRKVALKVMLPQYAAIASSRTRFLREARAAASLSHDNVVTIHEADERDGVTYLAMQLLQGKPLDQYLKERGELQLRDVLRIGRETAHGLAAAHARGLVHRDIKPANLWLEAPRGRVKILDFGLAKPTEAERHDSEMTATGVVMGTPSYMPPEQAMGETVDFRADLYSLGVLLYRLTTGRLPFSGPTMMAMLTTMMTQEPPAVRALKPDVPDPLARLIHHLLAKKAADRPATAAKVAEALRQIELGRAAAVTVQAIPLDSLPTATQIPVGADPFANFDATEEAAPPAEARRKTPKWPLVALGLLLAACLAVVPQIVSIMTPRGTLVIESEDPDVEVTVKQDGAVLVDKSKKREIALKVGDNYTIDLSEPKDGLKLSTSKFEITRNGKTTVKVRVDKPKDVVAKTPAPATVKDTERVAAEYAFSVSRWVKVNDQEEWIANAAALPKSPFVITNLSLDGGSGIADADLKCFKDCQRIKHLNLQGTGVTDEGLANFKNCKEITNLTLADTRITDAGLINFEGCSNLTRLALVGASVSDDGLKHFRECKSLLSLGCSGGRVTDRGVAYFQNCTEIVELSLLNTKVTDAGLAVFNNHTKIEWLWLSDTPVGNECLKYFKNCRKVRDLNLANTKVDRVGLGDFPNLVSANFTNTKVNDEGLVALSRCKSLEVLTVTGTEVSDLGLVRLEGLPSLRALEVSKTKVTEAGVKQLGAKLPNCRIDWNGGTISPKAPIVDPAAVDRKAAEYVLSVGGTALIDDQAKEIKSPMPLPAGPFALTAVLLRDNKKVTDAGLACFQGCSRVKILDVGMTAIGDSGVANFKGCKGLTKLNLLHSAVTDTGLAVFAGNPNLTSLMLSGLSVTDTGIEAFRDCKKLTDLSLAATRVTDQGVGYFRGCDRLTELHLHDTRVTDTGLATFRGIKSLTLLHLEDTAVTDLGIENFKESQGLTSLTLDRTKVGSKSLAPFPNLISAYLSETQVDDDGVAHLVRSKGLGSVGLSGTRVTDKGLSLLEGCPTLKSLSLTLKTKVSAGAVDRLAAKLPKCRIEWDGGTIEAKKD